MVGPRRRDLDQVRRRIGDLVEGLKLNLSLIGDGQQMQHRVGRAAQGGIDGQRIADARSGQVAPGRVAAPRDLHRGGPRLAGENEARRIGRRNSGVAGQGEPQSLSHAAHGVGGEQTGA
jgi:hypothetical protein